jgi:ligand-binding sensor domain-containing protein
VNKNNSMGLFKFFLEIEMKIHKILILALAITILPQSSFAQNWKIFKKSNSGLPDNAVYSVAIDKDGAKWIGTNKGLVKYHDGNWLVFNESNSEIPVNEILDISIDKNGNMWIGGVYIGLAKFDGKNWIVYDHSDAGLPKSEFNVKDVQTDDSGNIWIGTFTSGLLKFDGSKWKKWDTSNTKLPSNNIRDIAIDSTGTKWIASGVTSPTGLARFNDNKWKIYNSTNSALPCEAFHRVAIGNDGSKWVICYGEYTNLVRFRENLQVFDPFNSPLPDEGIYGISVDKFGNKWLASWRGGLIKYNDNDWKVYNMANSKLPTDKITTVSADDMGNVWVGNQTTSGLIKFEPETTSIDNPKKRLGRVIIHPNPAKNQLYVQTNANTLNQTFSYTLHTLTGQKAQSGELNDKSKHTINVSNLSPGVYLLEVQGKQAVKTVKVVIE